MSGRLIVIPAFKPSEGLVALAREIREASELPMLIVDDGSGPEFGAIFQQLLELPGTAVIRHAINLGKGAALKHAFNHALTGDSPPSWFITADADGQHLAGDILTVAEASRSDALVLGWRQFDAGVPLRSRVGNVVSRYVYRFLTGLRIRDTQTGLRSIPAAFARKCLLIASNRYEFETEQLILAKDEGLGFEEVPISTVYLESNESSHFNPLFDSFKIYFVLLRYATSSLATALTDLALFWILSSQGASVLAANLGARGGALWLQFILLKRFVFKTRGGLLLFLAYVTYVFLSGFVSASLQVELARALAVPSMLAKVVVESAVFCFNFLFLRDLVFREWRKIET